MSEEVRHIQGRKPTRWEQVLVVLGIIPASECINGVWKVTNRRWWSQFFWMVG